eukprot:TRINITY_DN67280_c0_g1_i1.p2 TRINITY_DN67280_c0_g1~~TRINITY_DN67280_c0_g1_i1.p2  ORF type:complete len:158 (+),score=30.72 TRINITY_DN67280_c0_g1_i1:100-573(+)
MWGLLAPCQRAGLATACAVDASAVLPRAAPRLMQRRWRNTAEGHYGPRYCRFPTEVKLEYPPKERSELWLLPKSKRIMLVTNGWYYPDGRVAADNKKHTPVLTFAARHSHNHIDSLTDAEVKAFEALVPEIRKQFAECKKTLSEEEARDTQSAHECR